MSFTTSIGKGKSIRSALRKGFRDGTSQWPNNRCYGYDIGTQLQTDDQLFHDIALSSQSNF